MTKQRPSTASHSKPASAHDLSLLVESSPGHKRKMSRSLFVGGEEKKTCAEA